MVDEHDITRLVEHGNIRVGALSIGARRKVRDAKQMPVTHGDNDASEYATTLHLRVCGRVARVDVRLRRHDENLPEFDLLVNVDYLDNVAVTVRDDFFWRDAVQLEFVALRGRVPQGDCSRV